MTNPRIITRRQFLRGTAAAVTGATVIAPAVEIFLPPTAGWVVPKRLIDMRDLQRRGFDIYAENVGPWAMAVRDAMIGGSGFVKMVHTASGVEWHHVEFPQI